MAVNPIQEKRIKQYFLEATKEILIGEGISALSVRNVAKRAGYSYATLYNYFKSLSELISFSILDFQKECTLHIEEKTKRVASGDRKLKAIVRAYADYFIQYPALFHLFYIEKLSSNKVNRSAALFLNELCQSEFDDSITKGTFTKKEVDLLQEQLRITIPGILLLYLNRSHPETYKEFIKVLNQQLEALFPSLK